MAPTKQTCEKPLPRPAPLTTRRAICKPERQPAPKPQPAKQHFAGMAAARIARQMHSYASTYGVQIDSEELSYLMFEHHGQEADGCFPPSSGSDRQGDGMETMAECVVWCVKSAIERKRESQRTAGPP
jgi:hypothetical protein